MRRKREHREDPPRRPDVGAPPKPANVPDGRRRRGAVAAMARWAPPPAIGGARRCRTSWPAGSGLAPRDRSSPRPPVAAPYRDALSAAGSTRMGLQHARHLHGRAAGSSTPCIGSPQDHQKYQGGWSAAPGAGAHMTFSDRLAAAGLTTRRRRVRSGTDDPGDQTRVRLTRVRDPQGIQRGVHRAFKADLPLHSADAVGYAVRESQGRWAAGQGRLRAHGPHSPDWGEDSHPRQ